MKLPAHGEGHDVDTPVLLNTIHEIYEISFSMEDAQDIALECSFMP